jgi:proline dehydrogenase
MASSDTVPLPSTVVDFTNTEIAFAHKSNGELTRMAWLFRLMNKSWLVKLGSAVGLWLYKTGIPIFNPIIRVTIFKQFCSGTSLEDSSEALAHLYSRNTKSVLDYGAEAKETDEDFDQTLQQNLKSIQYAAGNPAVPVISVKLTALVSMALLEKKQRGEPFDADEQAAYARMLDRLDQLCSQAAQQQVAIYIDAEETWIQDPIDALVISMMTKYNRTRASVFQTYQMYRKDKLKDLHADHAKASADGYILGAKVVRGAYMEKERERAARMGYPSPIQDTKEDTDRDFNDAIRYCVDHYDEIAFCNASHNLHSNQMLAELIVKKAIPRDHPHISFCQLYGMSDYITFNLAQAGFNVAKYVPYGPVREVVPYLIRRARENTAVTGEMSRELSLIMAEIQRRSRK